MMKGTRFHEETYIRRKSGKESYPAAKGKLSFRQKTEKTDRGSGAADPDRRPAGDRRGVYAPASGAGDHGSGTAYGE